MKLILNLIFIVVFISGTCFGQKKISEKEIIDLYTFYKNGDAVQFHQKIDSIRNFVTEKDSLYEFAIGISAELNEEMHYFPEAIKGYEELLTFFKSGNFLQSSIIDSLSYLEKIADLKMYTGDFEGSIAAHKTKFETNKRHGITDTYNGIAVVSDYNGIATVYNLAGKYQDALNILNLNPNKIAYYCFNYSTAYYNLNQLDSAKRSIERLFSDSTMSINYAVFLLAAKIYSAIGDKKNACEFISKASKNLIESGEEETFKKLPEKTQNCFYVKKQMREFKEIEEMKLDLCK